MAPSFFALAFVGTLTVLLSLSSLELTYKRDFALEPALRRDGRLTLAAAALGGSMGVISIGRSTMCRQTGGGRQHRPDLATRLDHHVILSLANTVGRASTALSQQED